MCNASGRTFVASPIMTQTQRERERERDPQTQRQTTSRTAKGRKTTMGGGGTAGTWAGFVEKRPVQALSTNTCMYPGSLIRGFLKDDISACVET
jgi:hypothetical protein